MIASVLLLLMLLALGVSGTGCSRGREEAGSNNIKPPFVVLVSLDTLRADRLGLYGYERDTSRHLAALAGESVVFTTVAAQSTQTLISHKSILTGKYPLRLIREANNADLKRLSSLDRPQAYLVATFRSLKSKPLVSGLRDHAYKTAAFTDGGWMGREMGFADGFDVFDDGAGHLAGILPRVYDWLARNGGERFFLFIHTYDTHCPYPCREPYNSLFCRDHAKHIPLEGLCGKPHLMKMTLSSADKRAISDHYDGGIASADAYVGGLLEKLRELKLYDEALIIVTSDHGESLGEHDQIGHGGLYLEQLLVPLIIKFPASWKIKPKIIEEPVELVDILPTVYDACSLELPADADGRSLLPLVRTGCGHRRYLIAQTTYREGRELVTNPAKRAILYPGRWLLIHDAREKAMELFDLRTDPKGWSKVPTRGRPVVRDLLAGLIIHDREGAVGEFTEPEETQMSEELIEQLRSLGYVGD